MIVALEEAKRRLLEIEDTVHDLKHAIRYDDLTEKIAEAIRVFGDQYGWWRDGADSNIFTPKLFGAPYNSTYAWLLYCGIYVE